MDTTTCQGAASCTALRCSGLTARRSPGSLMMTIPARSKGAMTAPPIFYALNQPSAGSHVGCDCAYRYGDHRKLVLVWIEDVYSELTCEYATRHFRLRGGLCGCFLNGWLVLRLSLGRFVLWPGYRSVFAWTRSRRDIRCHFGTLNRRETVERRCRRPERLIPERGSPDGR